MACCDITLPPVDCCTFKRSPYFQIVRTRQERQFTFEDKIVTQKRTRYEVFEVWPSYDSEFFVKSNSALVGFVFKTKKEAKKYCKHHNTILGKKTTTWKTI